MLNAKENILRVIYHNNPEWVPNGMESLKQIFSPVVERRYSVGPDDFGVEWDLEPEAEGGTFPKHGGNPIDDIEHWEEQLKIPDLDNYDWEAIRKKAESIDREQHLVGGFVEMGLFERSYLLFGMENALVYYLTEPEEMKKLIHKIADFKIDVINRFDEAADLDIIWYGDDWGTQTNLFLPPAVWRDIIKPETKRIYDCMKSHGIIVNQHSCGKIESVFEDIVEMGADMWNPCQPCNDLAGLKKKYGDRITFCGGIDSQFVLARPGVTPEEVDAEVKKRIYEMGENGGYIAAPSHSVPYKKELLDAMVNAIHKYGREIYQK